VIDISLGQVRQFIEHPIKSQVMLQQLSANLVNYRAHVVDVSTILVYASSLHKWHYIQVLPNISQRTQSAFHYSFWQMNTIIMGFLLFLGKI
jgi:hypothetical protein